MNIAICDDLLEDRNILQGYIDEFFASRDESPVITTFESADELLSEFDRNSWHIIFMDIFMEGMSGVEASRKIRAIDKDCAIIFTTTSPDHAMAGYEVKAADYLLKPFTAAEVAASLNWALENLSFTLRTIDVVSDRNHLLLPVQDILYVEVYKRECQIHMADGQVIPTNRPLGAFAEELGSSFLRCHRSYLVNMPQIQKPEKDSFRLTNGESVPVGTDMISDCRHDYFEWAFRRTWEGE